MRREHRGRRAEVWIKQFHSESLHHHLAPNALVSDLAEDHAVTAAATAATTAALLVAADEVSST